MQYFKGDTVEKQFYNSAAPMMDLLSLQKDLFYAGAYTAAPLADVIYDNKRAPLTNAILRDIFRLAFSQIFTAFIGAGTFENYIVVFKKIFGDSVSVTFTVPAAGKLTIAIVAAGVELTNFITRDIVNNAYTADNQVTYDLDQIVFQTIQGFQSQYELTQMLNEMVPAGIFTTITLTLQGA